MKINEVEQQVGVTKRNIRFYEKEGLLSPGRNSDNGYRNYDDADVEALKKIKLFRKLNVPLDEIRKMQTGALTLPDAMSRHMIQLERDKTNLEAMRVLCAELSDSRSQLDALDADLYLSKMEQQEREGTRFMNIKKNDIRFKYAGAAVAALVMVAIMSALIALMVWAAVTDPAESPPLGILAFLIAIPAVIIVGVCIALWQRFGQIKGGEEDAAAQY